MRSAWIGLIVSCALGCAGGQGGRELDTRTNDVVGVVVHITVKPDRVDEFIELYQRTMIEPALRAPGCLRYELWQDLEASGRLTILEEWESEEAHATHLSGEWLHEAAAAFQSFTTEPFEIQRLRQTR